VFVVCDLVHGTESRVHSRRLRFYSDRHLRVTAEMRDIIAAASSQTRNDEYYADRLLAHRKRGGVWEFEVAWLGFEDADSTWEDGDGLRTHAEQLLMQYVRALPASEDKAELMLTYGRAQAKG
jgi:Chromo (CHRromatin Organisation MOdifier) domain